MNEPLTNDLAKRIPTARYFDAWIFLPIATPGRHPKARVSVPETPAEIMKLFKIVNNMRQDQRNLRIVPPT